MADTKTRIVIDAIDKTKIAVDSAKSNLNSLSSTASTLSGVMLRLAPLLGAATFTGFVKGGIDTLDMLGDLSDRTGVAATTLAGFKLVAAQSDTSLEALGKGLNKLTIYMAENGKEAKKLGLTSKEPSEAFIQLAKTLSNIDDVGQRNAVANKVLGKSYQELLPALLQGEDALRKQIDTGKEYSNVTEEGVRQAQEFNDKLDLLKEKAGAAGVGIGWQLLPALDEITNNFIRNTEKGGVFLATLAAIGNIAKIAVVGTEEQRRIDRIQELTRYITFQTEQLNNASKDSNKEVLANLRTNIAVAKKEAKELILIQSEAAEKLAVKRDEKNTPPSDLKDIFGCNDKKSATETLQEQIALIRQENNLVAQGVPLEDARTIAKQKQLGIGDETIVQLLNVQAISRQLADEEKKREDAKKQLIEDEKIFNEGDIRAIETEIELANEQLAIERQMEEQRQAGIDAYDAELEKINKQTEDLQFQLSIQDMSKKLQQEKIEARNVEIALQETLNALAEQGLGLSEEEISALRDKYTEIAKLGGQLKANKITSKEIAMTFNSAMEDAIVSGKNFRDVLKGVEDDIVRILLRKTVTKPFTDAIDSIDFGSIFSSIFNANGNAFNKQGVMPFADGGIVNRTTPFLFANGGRLGVMGEAGPEAILPLRRGANGKLGVQSDGMGGANVTVNIIGAPVQPQVRQNIDGNGNMNVDVIFDAVKSALGKDIRSEGSFAQILQGQYGLNRAAGAR